MYEISELGSMTTLSAGSGRVFFSIYYANALTVPDAAFERAARTWRNSVQVHESFRQGRDVFIEAAVTSEPDFKRAWQGIANQARINNMPVWVGNVLSHSSKSGTTDGLEFASVGGDGTITQSDIASLERMPWDRKLRSYGGRSWAPAKEFAMKQRVRTLGQTGYAYFSKVWTTYFGVARFVLIVDALIWIFVVQRVASHPENHWGLDNRYLVALFALQLVAALVVRKQLGQRLWRALTAASVVSVLASMLLVQLNILVPYELWIRRGMPERWSWYEAA